MRTFFQIKLQLANTYPKMDTAISLLRSYIIELKIVESYYTILNKSGAVED